MDDRRVRRVVVVFADRTDASVERSFDKKSLWGSASLESLRWSARDGWSWSAMLGSLLRTVLDRGILYQKGPLTSARKNKNRW